MKKSLTAEGILKTGSIKAFAMALSECSQELQEEALGLLKDLTSGELDEYETHATVALLAEILYPNADADDGMPGLELVKAEEIARRDSSEAKAVLEKMDAEEASFAERLRLLMSEKAVTQVQLASLTGIGQPAISMMLQRSCRPQKRTVCRFADALGVKPGDLWPGFEK